MITPYRRRLDVSGLPSVGFGPRATTWWGVLLMIAIEGTMFGLTLLSYFYIRQNERMWPTTPAGYPATVAGGVGLAALLISVAPMVLTARAAFRGSLSGMRRWLIVTTVLGLVFLACRAIEMRTLLFRWDNHAYGSVFWTILGLHTFHGVASTGENLMFIALLYLGPVEKKHHVDLQVNALYWYFVTAVWAVFFPILYLEDLWLP